MDDFIRVRHMLEAAQEASHFCDGMTVEMLQADRMRSLAVVRCFEILGEAATTVTSEFKAAHPQVPWRVISSMRNRLVHAYFSVDIAVVIETSRNDLPPLIEDLTTILQSSQT